MHATQYCHTLCNIHTYIRTVLHHTAQEHVQYYCTVLTVHTSHTVSSLETCTVHSSPYHTHCSDQRCSVGCSPGELQEDPHHSLPASSAYSTGAKRELRIHKVLQGRCMCVQVYACVWMCVCVCMCKCACGHVALLHLQSPLEVVHQTKQYQTRLVHTVLQRRGLSGQAGVQRESQFHHHSVLVTAFLTALPTFTESTGLWRKPIYSTSHRPLHRECLMYVASICTAVSVKGVSCKRSTWWLHAVLAGFA